jgi:hypothetical protein
MTDRARDRVEGGHQIRLLLRLPERVVESGERDRGTATLGRQAPGEDGEKGNQQRERKERRPVDSVRLGCDRIGNDRARHRCRRQEQAEAETPHVGRERHDEQEEHEPGAEGTRDRHDDELDRDQPEQRGEDASRESRAARRDRVEERRSEDVGQGGGAEGESLAPAEAGSEDDADRDGEANPQPQVPARSSRPRRGHAAPVRPAPQAIPDARTPAEGVSDNPLCGQPEPRNMARSGRFRPRGRLVRTGYSRPLSEMACGVP